MKILDFRSKIWLNQKKLLSKTSFHQSIFRLFQLLWCDTYFVGNWLLSVDDQNLSVSQVFKQTVNVLFWFITDFSLLVSGLLSQSFIFWLDKLKGRIDYLGISLDMKSINGSRKILDLNCRFCNFQSILSKRMLKSWDKFLGFWVFLKETAALDLFLNKSIGFLKFQEKGFIGVNILFEYFAGFFFDLFNGFWKFGFILIELKPSKNRPECLFRQFFPLNSLDDIWNIITLQFLHISDKPSLLNFPIKIEWFG